MGPFRLDPKMPAASYKTYEISAPQASHWRPASCAEVGCDAHERGWRTVVDEATDLGQGQGYYIRREAGRRFAEHRDEAGRTVFVFVAGQTCFRPHRVRLDREALFVVRGGDWRGNPLGVDPYRHTRPEFWVEDFATHQQSLADRLARG